MFKNDRKALWLGVNGMEYISWEGSHDIYVYDPYYRPLPTEIIHYQAAIYTQEDMMSAIEKGKHLVIKF